MRVRSDVARTPLRPALIWEADRSTPHVQMGTLRHNNVMSHVSCQVVSSQAGLEPGMSGSRMQAGNHWSAPHPLTFQNVIRSVMRDPFRVIAATHLCLPNVPSGCL